jgi:sodium transport system permease protein
MMSVQRGFELTDFLSLVPVINMSLFFREVMEGTYDIRHIVLVFASTTIYATCALRGAVKLFRDENALFSLEKPFALFVRRRLLKAKPQPSFGEAIFLSAAVFILFYYVSPVFQGSEDDPSAFFRGSLVSQWLLIFIPTLLFARYLKVDFGNTFRLRGFRPIHILAPLLLYAGSFFLLVELAVIQRRLIPMPEFWEKASEGLGQGNFWLAVLAVAISPAICEEMMFRGFVLAGFHRFSPRTRIILNGVLFGLHHVFIFRLLPTAFLGGVIAFIVIFSGSIFPGMLFHLVHNFVGLVLIHYPEQSADFFKEAGLGGNAREWFEAEAHLPPLLLAGSAIVFLVGAFMTWKFRKKRASSSPDHPLGRVSADGFNEGESQET